MKKKHYSEFFILLNLINADIHLCKTVRKASEITNVSKNTISAVDSRKTLNNWLCVRIIEE